LRRKHSSVREEIVSKGVMLPKFKEKDCKETIKQGEPNKE
jgi:hypothetical protein